MNSKLFVTVAVSIALAGGAVSAKEHRLPDGTVISVIHDGTTNLARGNSLTTVGHTDGVHDGQDRYGHHPRSARRRSGSARHRLGILSRSEGASPRNLAVLRGLVFRRFLC
jgi:hypothetical protein